MIVESLSLQSFMGYARRCALEFQPRCTVGIIGANEQGKSTLLQAISYGLYGRTRAEREAQLVNDQATADLIVELAVRLSPETKLEITRGRTRKGEPVLRVGGFNGKPSDVADYIAEQLRLSYQDYVALSYFVQGDIHQFMEGDKREYFQRWTAGLRIWQQLEEQAAAELRQVEEQERTTEYKLSAAKQSLAHADERDAEVKAAARDAVTAERRAQLLQEQLATLRATIKVQEEQEDARESLDALKERLRRAERRVERATADEAERQQELLQARAGLCPVMPDAKYQCRMLMAHSKPERDTLQQRIVAAQQAVTEARADADDVRAQVEEAERQVVKTSAATLRWQVVEVERTLNDANRELRRAQQRQAQAEAAVAACAEAKVTAESLRAEQERLAVELRRWQLVRFMCGRSGVPALLIDKELERVEDRCNWVLERLDYPKRIRFSGFKELAGFERVCPVCGSESWHAGACRGCGAERPHKRRDEPTITVMDGDKERPFALESGGARVLQSFAVRLAGSLFVASMTGVPMKLIMLDETFGMLDPGNRQKLLALVTDKLSSEFGLEQQFIVSHNEEVSNAVDSLLVVRRERGSSVATWG